MAASASFRFLLWGDTSAGGSLRVAVPTKVFPARAHFWKNSRMSTTRSLIRGMLRKGSITITPSSSTRLTWVRHVQRGLPLTVIAQDPHTPTRQA
ncbi:hypothetical protein D9M68_770090 [compost metagenome]